MKKRIEMRLGEYRLIGKLAEDGAVTVLVEHALERSIEAEMTLGGDDHRAKPGLSPEVAQSLKREILGILDDENADEGFVGTDDEEPAIAPASRVQVQPQEAGFPARPGMTRSRIEPSDD